MVLTCQERLMLLCYFYLGCVPFDTVGCYTAVSPKDYVFCLYICALRLRPYLSSCMTITCCLDLSVKRW